MSFSSEIKTELAKQISNARHCQLAELSAIFDFCGTFEQKNVENSRFFLNCENVIVAKKSFTLLKKSFNINFSDENTNDLLSKSDSTVIELTGTEAETVYCALVSPTVTQKSCCRRAYLRGACLCGASVSDPEKSYHFEIVCKNEGLAEKIKTLLSTFEVDARVTLRNKSHILYIKESSQIVDTLNIIEAPVALMEFENAIILKDMRNSINRRNNCDTANISKTVSAAVKQIEEIQFLLNTEDFKKLPETVKDIARLRLDYPEASLKELGELCDPPLGKSGVNHRLRKLSEMAEKLGMN